MDSRVLQTQEWLNKTYGQVAGFPTVVEDGITGQATFRALIYALQIEIGINNPDGVFGNDTLSKCPTLKASLIPDSDIPRNIIFILQGSLWCKGISPKGFTGIFGPFTANAIYEFQVAAGITADKVVYPYVLQGIMNTDGYTFKSTGDVYDTYRHEIQMGLNKYYGARIGLIAPNGIWERKSHKNLIKAIQLEWGTTVDGSFGNGTLSKAPTLSKNTSGYTNSKRLLQWCLTINGFYPGSFSGTFDTNTYNNLYAFQQFVCLGADGICGKQTWASLITSRGSSDRKATALDTSKKISLENATAIKNAGYTDIGRYLTNTPDSTFDKAMTYEELEILKSVGLNVFPIFQTRGNSASYFTAAQGAADALTAKEAAQNFGFPSSATIYFCVDYDVLMADVESKILPYFRNVKAALGNAYKIGAYGPRYICTKLAEMNLSTSSFVCDMSAGFTCNIGQKLPENWAYDQFAEISTSDSAFIGMDYDKCIASPRKTATRPEDFLPSYDDYDNSVYTYEQVLAGTGHYRRDCKLRYSEGVETMQTKLNAAGYSCGTPNGKFGGETDAVVRAFQNTENLIPDGKVEKNTLIALDAATSGGSPDETYDVIFDNVTKRFDTNAQVVYEHLANAGLGKIAIAGIMGNIHAENAFNTTWSNQGSVGICQWLDTRKNNLEAFANAISGSKTDINVQAAFILEECSSTSPYSDSIAVTCFKRLKDSTVIVSVKEAADNFTALYERCYCKDTWEEVKSACDSIDWLTLDRFSQDANMYNSKFYLDTPKRRGYAESYYSCLLKI